MYAGGLVQEGMIEKNVATNCCRRVPDSLLVHDMTGNA